jgi:predicted transcriptional regulator
MFSSLNLVLSHTNSISEERLLFITDNGADFELATSITQNLNKTATILDIRTSDDLNLVFSNYDVLNNYNAVILILNQVSNPLNEDKILDVTNFINEGGLFGIISTNIWRFPSSFHSLLGLNINEHGPKEFPMGNATESIQILVKNDSFLQIPFNYGINSSLNIQAAIGISDTLDSSYQIAVSNKIGEGSASINGFQRQKGFVISVPMSPIVSTPSLNELSEFLSSLMFSGLEEIQNIDLPAETVQTTTSPGLLFSISEETIQTGIVIGSISIFIIGMVYAATQLFNKSKTSLDLPKDRSFFTSLLLSPIIFIGQILYPPIVRRIDEYDVMENEYRNQILEILNDRDFLHFRELKRELEIGTSSLRWHLQVLEDFRMIDRQKRGQYEIYYLIRKKPEPSFLELYFAIISGGGFSVAKAFTMDKSWNLESLSEYLGKSKENIRYHCKKFEEMNLLIPNGGRYKLNPQKQRILLAAVKRRQKTN